MRFLSRPHLNGGRARLAKVLLAAIAAMIATPSKAADGRAYVALEGGLVFPRHMGVEGEFLSLDPGLQNLLVGEVAELDFKHGHDVAATGGYDFGMFRLEGELGYKHATGQLRFDPAVLQIIGADPNEEFDVRVLSIMGSALLDVGGRGGISGFIGGGFGLARALGDDHNTWAGQLMAGVRMEVSSRVDLGLKYRLFRTGRLELQDEFDLGVHSGFLFSRDRFQSHSLLLSLAYNF